MEKEGRRNVERVECGEEKAQEQASCTKRKKAREGMLPRKTKSSKLGPTITHSMAPILATDSFPLLKWAHNA